MTGGSSNTVLDYRGHLSVLEHDQQCLSIRPRPGLVQSNAELVEKGRRKTRRTIEMHRETLQNQSVQSMRIIKRAHRQDGEKPRVERNPGLKEVTREVTWDREGRLANKKSVLLRPLRSPIIIKRNALHTHSPLSGVKR